MCRQANAARQVAQVCKRTTGPVASACWMKPNLHHRTVSEPQPPVSLPARTPFPSTPCSSHATLCPLRPRPAPSLPSSSCTDGRRLQMHSCGPTTCRRWCTPTSFAPSSSSIASGLQPHSLAMCLRGSRARGSYAARCLLWPATRALNGLTFFGRTLWPCRCRGQYCAPRGQVLSCLGVVCCVVVSGSS